MNKLENSLKKAMQSPLNKEIEENIMAYHQSRRLHAEPKKNLFKLPQSIAASLVAFLSIGVFSLSYSSEPLSEEEVSQIAFEEMMVDFLETDFGE